MMNYLKNKITRTVLSIFLVAVIVLAAFMAGNNIIAADGNNQTIGIALIVVGAIGFIASLVSKHKDSKK